MALQNNNSKTATEEYRGRQREDWPSEDLSLQDAPFQPSCSPDSNLMLFRLARGCGHFAKEKSSRVTRGRGLRGRECRGGRRTGSEGFGEMGFIMVDGKREIVIANYIIIMGAGKSKRGSSSREQQGRRSRGGFKLGIIFEWL